MAKRNLASKYGASSVKKMKSRVAKEDSIIDSGGSSDWIEMKVSGAYKIRLMPTIGDEPYSILRKQHWMEFESDNEEGKTYKSTVLNAVVHGGQKRDIIDCYIEMVKDHIEDSDWTAKDKKEAMDALLGQNGLKGSNSWIAYALQLITKQDPKFGLVEIKKVVRDRLNEEAIYDDDEEDGIDIDPYTCPVDGKYVILTFNKAAKHWSKYWKVKIGKKRPLSEEELGKLDDAKPLTELFYYDMSDFKKALLGLQFFDEKNEIGLFEEDEWNDLVEELELLLEESLKKAKKSTKSKPKDEEVEDEVEEIEDDELDELDDELDEVDDEDDEVEDEFTAMTRKQLISWAAKKLKAKEATKKDFPIKKSMSEDDIKGLIRSWVEAQEPDEEELEEDEEDDDLDAIKKQLAALNDDDEDKEPF